MLRSSRFVRFIAPSLLFLGVVQPMVSVRVLADAPQFTATPTVAEAARAETGEDSLEPTVADDARTNTGADSLDAPVPRPACTEPAVAVPWTASSVDTEPLRPAEPSITACGVHTSVLPAPAQDSCLHCHISGTSTAPTTPPFRWALFGLAGLVFAFGMVRSATVWRTRSPWRPLTARAAAWVDERYAITKPLSDALAKPVPRFARGWMYCLGGMTAFAFIVQATTGVMLAFYYKPTELAAYESIRYIEESVRFGVQVRTIHAWSANAMIVLCVAHMVRTFIVGAYKRPRELNWVTGVLLLVLTLAFGFTGYLLPWDQRAFWATTVGSDIAGGIPVIGDLALVLLRVGWTVTGATLGRFYALHVLVLPVATLAFMGLHFLMVRRLGVHRPL